MNDYRTICNSLLMNDSIWYDKISDNLEYYSYGCPDSRWDLETIVYQIDLDSVQKPTILIDTCCGIDIQENISKTLVQNLRAIYPEKQFIITGCGVNYDRKFYDAYGLTLNNQEKFDITNYPFKSIKRDIFFAPHSYGAVKIQDGCYQHCSYCVICKVRPHVTFTYEEIDKQIQTCLANGWSDILLFGTDICEYYKDGHDLLDVCKHILDTFPGITSLKLDSINPGYKHIYELIDFIKKEPRFQKDLDLAIQSCSDVILKSIGRTYTFDDIKKITKYAGEDVFIAHQIITGLPGETDDLFNISFNNMKQLKPQLITLCPYSKRKWTKAADAEKQVDRNIAQDREYLLRCTFNTAEYSSQYEFNQFKPKLNDEQDILHVNLYDTLDSQKVFKTCLNMKRNKEIVVITKYDKHKHWHDMEVNAKMLMVTFEAKIVTTIMVDDDIIERLNLPEFSNSVPTYLYIDFTKLQKQHDEDTIISFFEKIQTYGLDNIVDVVRRFVKAGNIYQIHIQKLASALHISIEDVINE